jgi:tRNA A37 threonylcarbamoyladenosine dehydratase
MSDYRFIGVQRLFGRDGYDRLRAAHVAIVGVGGVGSWTAEALARTAIGRLTLIDMDEVCTTNINRQLHALSDTVGRAKVDVMAERLHTIDPHLLVETRQRFFTDKTADTLLTADPPYDLVIDAIDSAKYKTLLIAGCTQRDIPVITIGGAGGKTDPSHILTGDLTESYGDTLLQMVRKRLRQNHHFPKLGDVPFDVDCVYNPQPPVYPTECGRTVAERPDTMRDQTLRLSCDQGFGAAVFLTGAMGFAAAALAVQRITQLQHTRPTGPPP